MIRPKLFSFFLLYIFAVLTPLVHPAPTSLDIRSPDNGIEAKLRQHGFGSLTDWTVFKDWFEKTSKSTWSKGPPSSQFAQGQFIAPGNLVEGNFVEDQCDGNYFYFAYARKNSDALTWRPLPENAGPLPLTEYLNGGGFVPGPGKTWRAFIKTSVSTLPLQGAELQMKAWAKDDVHIARVFDYFWVPDEDNGRSYLAMQTWGVVSEITPEIVAHIRGFPDGPKRLLELFRHLSVGVKNMHSAKVYHRDLKAENTLAYFHNRAHIYVAAIVDFDFATDQAELKKDDPHPGTPGYMAPEVVKLQDYEPAASDMFSLGMTFLVMWDPHLFTKATRLAVWRDLVGNADDNFTPAEILKRLKSWFQHPNLDEMYKIPDEILEVLSHILCAQNKGRWTAETFLSAYQTAAGVS